MRLISRLLVCALLSSAAGDAWADSGHHAHVLVEAHADDHPRLEQFATLDRTGVGTGAGMSLGLVGLQKSGLFFSRTEVFGEYLSSVGLGAYASLPVTHAYINGGDDVDTMGNMELGGVYRLDVAPSFKLAFRAGAMLPTAGNRGIEIASNSLSSFARLTDFSGAYPHTTLVRLALSPTYRHGNLFTRADLGVDLVVASSSDAESLVRFNVGVGMYVLPQLAVSTEVVTLATTGDTSGSRNRFIHTAALSVRSQVFGIEPHVSYSVPLDENLRGKLWSVSMGLARRF